jgi:hypothetical protein
MLQWWPLPSSGNSPCNPTTLCGKFLGDKDAMWIVLSGHNEKKSFLQLCFSAQDDFHDSGGGGHHRIMT